MCFSLTMLTFVPNNLKEYFWWLPETKINLWDFFFFLTVAYNYEGASLVAQTVKNPRAMQENWVPSLGWKATPEKGTAIHSSILAWRSPWTEEPDRIQSMGSQRVGHNWVTNTLFSLHGTMIRFYYYSECLKAFYFNPIFFYWLKTLLF